MKRIHPKTQAWITKMDDRTKRRIKEMDKIKRTGTSTEFEKGYRKGQEDLANVLIKRIENRLGRWKKKGGNKNENRRNI